MATIEEVKAVVVSLARDQVGYREGAGNYTKYSEMPELQTIYGWNVQGQPWCAIFVNWLFLTSYGMGLGQKITYGCSPSCSIQAGYYQKNGATTNVPAVGDQFFQYADGGINHTGIVVEVNGSDFVTIEGNYSDGVYEVKHNVYASDVATFGRPNWGLIADEPEHGEYENVVDPYWDECGEDSCPIDLDTTTVEMPLVQYGDKNYSVLVAQSILIGNGFSVGIDGADGDFGSNTLLAVRAFQRSKSITVDGSVGPMTWSKLLKG